MTGNEYQKAALRTASVNSNLRVVTALKKHGFSDKTVLLLNGVLGLGGESGECEDLVKKHLFQGHQLDVEHMAKELGDVAWYLAVTAYAIGYDLDDIFDMNVKKLLERYPNGFDAKRSLHRKASDI